MGSHWSKQVAGGRWWRSWRATAGEGPVSWWVVVDECGSLACAAVVSCIKLEHLQRGLPTTKMYDMVPCRQLSFPKHVHKSRKSVPVTSTVGSVLQSALHTRGIQRYTLKNARYGGHMQQKRTQLYREVRSPRFPSYRSAGPGSSPALGCLRTPAIPSPNRNGASHQESIEWCCAESDKKNSLSPSEAMASTSDMAGSSASMTSLLQNRQHPGLRTNAAAGIVALEGANQ